MGILLSSMGWQPITPEVEKELSSHPRLVMLYPHTSYFDFILYILYRWTSPVFSSRCRVLINPYWMDLLGHFLEPLGGIRATRREDSGGGVVPLIIRKLRNQEFIFLISPKGCRDRHRWRSGYYQIAVQTGAEIVCAGFDYHLHRFVMSKPFDPSSMTMEEVERRCKQEMASITPMHPQWAEYPIRAHILPLDTSIINDEQLPVILSMILSVILAVLVTNFKIK